MDYEEGKKGGGGDKGRGGGTEGERGGREEREAEKVRKVVG